MKWKGPNKILGEMSDSKFLEKVRKQLKKSKSRDGRVVVYTDKRKHRGIPYLIKVIRYYDPTPKRELVKAMTLKESNGKWAVLEHPKSVKKIVDFVSNNNDFFHKSNFLWEDTMHLWNDGMTLRRRVEVMDDMAKSDIDWFFDEMEASIHSHISNVAMEGTKLLSEWKQIRGGKNDFL